MFLFDPLYLIIVMPTMLLALWASWRVKSTFARFSQVGVRSGMTGAEAAAAVARAGGAIVTIERHQGFLSDHYDPRSKTLRLSPDVYDGRSISSIAVAAHEAGHSIQDATGYAMLNFRSKMVPVTQIGSNIWMYVFLAGLVFRMPALQDVGIVLFGAVVLFQLVTLPVEFDASKRALAALEQQGLLAGDEIGGARAVLGAAALTYVAGFVASLGQLIYFFLISRD